MYGIGAALAMAAIGNIAMDPAHIPVVVGRTNANHHTRPRKPGTFKQKARKEAARQRRKRR